MGNGKEKMTDIENDIGTALMMLREAFCKHGLQCPDVVSYSDSINAVSTMRRLRGEIPMSSWEYSKRCEWIDQVNIAGFSLRRSYLNDSK